MTVRHLSQSDRILQVLDDGLEHSTRDIHAKAGFSRLNSRVAQLRRRGWVIECRHIEGVAPGPDAQTYRLLAAPSEATFGTAA